MSEEQLTCRACGGVLPEAFRFSSAVEHCPSCNAVATGSVAHTNYTTGELIAKRIITAEEEKNHAP